jgi:dephospho-CoA kinase
MIKVGLTGGIASGKSLVAALFKRLGATVVDADIIAREVVEPHTAGWQKVVAKFGPTILAPDGTIDRAKLGSIVFSDQRSRDALNAILHPYILNKIREQITEIAEKDPQAMIVVDVPLLIECGLQHEFDAVIVVWSPIELQRKRLMERDGLSAGEAQQRIDAQMALDQKRASANFVIENDADQEKTEAQVRDIFLRLRATGKGRSEKPE